MYLLVLFLSAVTVGLWVLLCYSRGGAICNELRAPIALFRVQSPCSAAVVTSHMCVCVPAPDPSGMVAA